MDLLEDVQSVCPNGEIDPNHVTLVTVNFDRIELGTDLTPIHKPSKSEIDKLIQRKLPHTAAIGSFQLALQERHGPKKGLYHAHFVLVHPYQTREEIKPRIETRRSSKKTTKARQLILRMLKLNAHQTTR